VELRQVVLIATLGATGFAACTRLETGNPPSVALGDGGTGGEGTGDPGSLAGDGGGGFAGEHSSGGAAPSGIELSLWPTFRADPEQSRDAQSVLASVAALAVGATTLTLAERWDELSGATGSPRAVTWSRLESMVKPYRERNGNVALCINLVDRTQPAWPGGTAPANLNVEAARQAMHSTIDEVYKRYAQQLSHLCFGYEVDRYLATVKEDAAAQFLDLLTDAVSYAQNHRPPTAPVKVGVAVTLGALTDAEATKAPWLLGDEAVGVYDPLAAGALKPPASGAEEIDSALGVLSDVSLPLALWEVGYPSGADSTEKRQQQYYDELLTLLDARREQLSFVSLYGLDDRAASDCDAEAPRFGDDAAAVPLRSQARCSMGLRADGVPKLAWPSALSALARYR
jgi:hypothetical protein